MKFRVLIILALAVPLWAQKAAPTINGLPQGMSLTPAGVLQGTPTCDATPGTYQFTVQASDSEQPPVSGQRQFSLLVVGDTAVNPQELPAARTGVAYNPLPLSAGCGLPPYTWSVVTGTSPTPVGPSK